MSPEEPWVCAATKDAACASWQVGGGRAAGAPGMLVTLVYGLNTFWLWLSLSPTLCYSIWLGLPSFFGLLSAEDVALVVRTQLHALTTALVALCRLELGVSWDELLPVELLSLLVSADPVPRLVWNLEEPCSHDEPCSHKEPRSHD